MRFLLAVAALVPALVACGGDDGWERAACDPGRPQPAGTHEVTVEQGRALLHVPEGYDGAETYPMVFSWHGYGSNALDHLAYADLRPVAARERFLVLVPEGSGDPSRFNLTAGIVGERDDVAFAEALIDHVEAGWCLDTARVYSTGVSNGAGMSALLACRIPERIAAIGMVALLLHFDGCEGPPMPVLGMMGDHDLVVPIQGGAVNCCGRWPIAPAVETMRAWADEAACTERREKRVTDDVTRTVWSGCDGGVEVRYDRIGHHGHTWPGAPDVSVLGPTTDDIDASRQLWEFFRRYERA